MKLPRTHLPPAPDGRRGAALLLSFLVLIVIVAIVYQLNRVTGTDQQVANKDLVLTRMDLAIASALLEVGQQLRQDGELKLGAGEDPVGEEPGGPAAAEPAGEEGAAGGSPDAVDSRMDEWAQVASTTINDIDLRILIVDEDSKYNILNMLSEDEDLAQETFDRVVRILDACRENTLVDISGPDADEMARVLRDHMLERSDSYLPRPKELLTDDEELEARGIPLTLREFVVLEPFTESHFRDFFDADGNRVHGIGAFLTIYTAPFTEGDAESASAAMAATGGYGVNVNTAPLAVLASLLDSRDVDTRFWDQVLEYRNTEEEPLDGEEEPEPILDEFGNEVPRLRFFDSLEELSEVPDWDRLEPEERAMIEELLTVESDVFSVYITGRKTTAEERNQILEFESRLEQEQYERSGAHLTRTVRAVLWRQMTESEVKIVPLVNWEVLDYSPLPVLDIPDE